MSKKRHFEYFYDAWWFLHNHEMFVDKSLDSGQENGKYLWTSRFQDCLDIDVQKVNPNTGRIDDKKSLNTETEVWLECGPWYYHDEKDYVEKPYWAPSHDWNLDCGGTTFENAIIRLANLVYKHYGDKPAGYL